MGKKTAKAPVNIAFIKYWGKKDEGLRLPLNSSFSLNLSGVYTITTVEFSEKYSEDKFFFLEKGNLEEAEGKKKWREIKGREKERVREHLERIRRVAKTQMKAKIVTENNFPKGAGLASSASGFAALTLAACEALNLNLSLRELSILARLASGSACRSIPDGFVEWKEGKKNEESYAFSLYGPDYWDIRDLILIFSQEEKSVSSSEGQKKVLTSPFLETRLKNLPQKIALFRLALKEKNFPLFGEIIEEEALEFQSILITQKPPLFYLKGSTFEAIKKIIQFRKEGLPVYFTFDAGPNLHLIYEGKKEKEVIAAVKKIKGWKKMILNQPSLGARLINKHLF